ncbi:hypothetical protein TTHERM_00561210 (macronuclear) [Tetrahymena thermophila SB210]|uniref:Transmembrane protein n=1 Tax=Tetrahymena thermophila (strain SB210) TaxID=312017 RepID=I7LU55_TETTS|nr:hypothetical protein TTHERM_00561210 [Tetrahymena thermophila SB210]EAR89930.1 hypothetical protein TTHERM_00561210 [Tetrahymena thermophila SB210]|eukprot:XP_001010175.1 hypothetical protein TTHERM_00561210 [Tetrahymena thermophila SB210]
MTNKNKNTKFQVLLLLLLSFNIIKSQTINLQKIVNLQSNERYIQSLSDFVKEPAYELDLVPSASSSLLQPYSLLSTDKNSPPLLDIATFNQGVSTKYIIGIQQVIQQDKIQLSLVYQQLSIDKECSCIKQKTFNPQPLDEVQASSDQLKLYGSFYSSTAGFISYMAGNVYKSYNFQINSQGEATFKYLSGVSLYDHVAILGPQNSIYIIQIANNYYQLLKFDESFNQKFVKETYEDCQAEIHLIDTGRNFFNYCYSIKGSYIKTVSIDFTVENFQFTQIDLNMDQVVTPQLQRIGNQIFIGLTDQLNKKFTILTLNSNQSIIDQQLSLQSQVTIDLTPLFIVKFISTNLLMFYPSSVLHYSSNMIYLYDLNNQVLIYENYVCEFNLYINKVENLGNQIMIYLYDKIGNYQSTLAAEINNPSLIIQTQTSTTEPITLNIKTISTTTYQVQINVNIVQQNTILFTQSLVSLQNTIESIQTQNLYTIPIEDFVVGSDLDLTVTVDQSKGAILNPKIVKYLQIQGNDQNVIDQSCLSYQTDGYFSSMFLCPVYFPQQGQVYYLRAVIPGCQGQTGQQKGDFVSYRSKNVFKYPLEYIDNYGSFNLKIVPPTSEIYIYIPYIDFSQGIGGQFKYNKIQVLCSEINFTFASDPAYNILFTLCGKTVTQTIFRFSSSDELIQEVSTYNLDIDSSQLTNLICIQGTLFMYNSINIIAYDYINPGFIGQISIPAIAQGKKQQVTLFKSSFLITVLDDPLTTIAQFSYNNFKTNDPTFMRNLQIDEKHHVNSQAVIIPKRQSEQEFAYILSTKPNTYYMYRINSKLWSNQLYATFTFDSKQTVISSYLLYMINPQQYTFILEEASVLYQLGITSDDFNSNLSQNALINLQISQQNHVVKSQNLKSVNSEQRIIQSLQSETSSLNINYIINRNASAQYGVVNNQASTLQQIRTQIQDSNFQVGQIFSFYDWQVFNSCILGWQNEDSYSKVIQRIQTQQEGVDKQVFTILYKFQATIYKESIQSFFLIQGQFQGCVVLDDMGSLQTNDNLNYQFNLYVICEKQISQYQIHYSVDQQTNKIITSSVSTQGTYTITSQGGWSVLSFKRIISANNQLILYSNSFLENICEVILDSQTQQAQYNWLYGFYYEASINIVQIYDTQLTIYPNGLIQTLLRSKKQLAAYNIATLLQQYNFIVSGNDQISQVDQYEDTKFRIAFKNSFVYDITFNVDAIGQLKISSVTQYYYQDAFSNYISGFIGTKYTLLFGENNQKIFTIALYSNSNKKQNIYLIESTIQIQSGYINNSPSSIIEFNPNKIQINDVTGKFIILNVEDALGIQMIQSENSLSQKANTSIQPLGQNNPDNSITFLLTAGTKSSASIQLFNLISIINIIIFLF